MEISKEIFEKEIEICKKKYRKEKGCKWGKCEHCGVLPLLQKLHEGVLIEDENDIKKLKESILDK